MRWSWEFPPKFRLHSSAVASKKNAASTFDGNRTGNYCCELSTLAFSASITAEKSWSARPSDFAALYSSFAAATVGMGWDTDSARAKASLRSCHEPFVWLASGTRQVPPELFVTADCWMHGQASRCYLLLMLQRKGSRICGFNHGWALQTEHGCTDSTLWNNLTG